MIGFGGLGVWLQLDAARGKHPDEAIAGVRSVLRVLVLFALVTPFWSLFDQKASTWVLQADAMTKPSWFQSSQMQALNPLLVMLLIPFNNLVLYPALHRFGYEMTALRRMTAGIAFSGLSWIVVGVMQVVLDGGNAFSITWQMLPYALLTFGEVLVSATGLEFAYSQAPPAMKGVIMAFWNLSVTIGNLWVLVVNAGVQNAGVIDFIKSSGFGVTAFQMFFFARLRLSPRWPSGSSRAPTRSRITTGRRSLVLREAASIVRLDRVSPYRDGFRVGYRLGMSKFARVNGTGGRELAGV